jgi:DNA gyrase/topoisomerase IV subunit A
VQPTNLLFDEFNELLEQIKYLLDILQNPEKLMQVIRDELMEIRENFSNDRMTKIIDNAPYLWRKNTIQYHVNLLQIIDQQNPHLSFWWRLCLCHHGVVLDNHHL